MGRKFGSLRGVVFLAVDHISGHADDPDCKTICTGRTEHTETAKVTFDDYLVGYNDMLKVFSDIHDPTPLDRPGADANQVYRSVLFYVDDEQLRVATESWAKEQERNNAP